MPRPRFEKTYPRILVAYRKWPELWFGYILEHPHAEPFMVSIEETAIEAGNAAKATEMWQHLTNPVKTLEPTA